MEGQQNKLTEQQKKLVNSKFNYGRKYKDLTYLQVV